MANKPLTQDQLAKVDAKLKTYMANKASWVKRYGKDAESVMRGRAISTVKKETEQMNKQKLKELVKKSLMQEIDTDANDEISSLFKNLEEKLKGHDWWYMMSDDNRYYMSGSAQASSIRGDIKTLTNLGYGKEAKELYNRYAPDQLKLTETKKEFPDLTGDGKVTKADILKGRGVDLDEDIDLGHQDNEPHMIKGELYQIGKYAMDLYAILEELEEKGGEYDFPAWWQSKITTAKNMMSGAKHYLDFELKEPAIDAAVDTLTGEEPHMGEPEAPMMEDKDDKHVVMKDGKFYTGTEFVSNIKDARKYNLKSATEIARREKGMVYTPKKINEDEVTKTDELAAKIAKALKGLKLKDASYDSDKDNLMKARKALNKGEVDAAEKIAKPYLDEKKLTKAEKKKKEDIVKGMKGSFKGSDEAMYAIATAKAKKVAEALTKKLKND